MNNSINNNYNINFNSRYFRILNENEMPKKIYYELYKSDAIEKFLTDGKPKTFFQKILNLFKKDEFLDVYYESKNNYVHDPYDITEILHFTFNKGTSKEKKGFIDASQKGIRRETGSIAKMGENKLFKPPIEKSEDKLAEKLKAIVDFDKILK